ncbi:ABC transporter ATP-binding protein [Stetteria hydrogenophila]
MASLLSARDVWKSYSGRVVLAGAGVEVDGRRIVGLIGPNGAGKTTLIKVCLGLARRDRGEVSLFGRDPFRDSRARERVGVVFERPSLPSGMPVYRFLEMAARVYGAPRGRVREVIKTVGLEGHEWKPYASLSAGLKQRAAIAHALIPEPELIVADEPTSNLDPVERVRLLNLLDRLRRDHGVGILFSSHVLHEVLRVADEVVVLIKGRVAARGPPGEIVLRGRPMARVSASDPERLAGILRGEGFDAEWDGIHVVARLRGPGDLPRLLEALAEAHRSGVLVYGFDVIESGLESILMGVASA